MPGISVRPYVAPGMFVTFLGTMVTLFLVIWWFSQPWLTNLYLSHLPAALLCPDRFGQPLLFPEKVPMGTLCFSDLVHHDTSGAYPASRVKPAGKLRKLYDIFGQGVRDILGSNRFQVRGHRPRPALRSGFPRYPHSGALEIVE